MSDSKHEANTSAVRPRGGRGGGRGGRGRRFNGRRSERSDNRNNTASDAPKEGGSSSGRRGRGGRGGPRGERKGPPPFEAKDYNAFPLATEAGAKNYEALAASLSEEDKKLGDALIAAGQGHIFAAWTAEQAQRQSGLRRAFWKQVHEIDAVYPGGLTTYLTRSRDLLARAKANANPYEGYRVNEPTDYVRLERPEDFAKWEAKGLAEAKDSAYVLVAGGLGERLGYDGIKVELPAEITSNKCYLQYYCEHILALQARASAAAGTPITIPLAIMTSDDTHKLTERLIRRHRSFGMARDQITLFKQGKVPALLDNDAHVALDEKNPFIVDSKPHGHGDVHTLLYQNKLVEKWVAAGKKWVVFFQDTNGLVFRAIPAALGVSAENKLDVNSITVPRVQGDAVGAICRLTREAKESKSELPAQLTINVEYNQLEGLLGKGVKEPIVKGTTNISVYPGNINVLVFNLPSYLQVLHEKKGIITEFVNPKYKPGTDNTQFTKPTRLECMMQDYPKLLPATARVSFTQFDRWTAFSAVKNKIAEAAAKQAGGNAPESAASGEADMYKWPRVILERAGVNLGPLAEKSYHGVKVEDGARVVLAPSVGVTQAEVASKFPGGAAVVVSPASTLMVEGANIRFESLKLAGTLIIKAAEGARVTVKDLTVTNKGWSFTELKELGADAYGIRGYQGSSDGEAETYVFVAPGEYVLSDETKVALREQSKKQAEDERRRRSLVRRAQSKLRVATAKKAELESELAKVNELVVTAQAELKEAQDGPLPPPKPRQERAARPAKTGAAPAATNDTAAAPATTVATINPREKKK